MRHRATLIVLTLGVMAGFIWYVSGRPTLQPNESETPQDTETRGQGIVGSWRWEGTGYGNGTDLIPTNPDQFILTFNSDGQFSGTTDCNRIMGSYQTEGDTLSFDGIAATKMACPGETYEQAFIAMLGEVRGYRIMQEGDLIMDIGTDGSSGLFSPRAVLEAGGEGIDNSDEMR